jgi:hypothetical protein
MKSTIEPIVMEHEEARREREQQRGSLQAVEGVLQRINYRTGEFKLVTAGKVWHFGVNPDCQLWFDDKPAILRCFHPLDPVRVIFEPAEECNRACALYAWEQP